MGAKEGGLEGLVLGGEGCESCELFLVVEGVGLLVWVGVVVACGGGGSCGRWGGTGGGTARRIEGAGSGWHDL